MTVLLLLVVYWKLTLSVIGALWLWRYAMGGKHGWTRRATNWLAVKVGRAIVPERPVHRRHHDVNPDPRFFSEELKAKAIRRDGPRCQCHGGCRSTLHNYSYQCVVVHGQGQRLQGGHRIAYARGGRTNLANLVMLCAACNVAWGTREMPGTNEQEWAA